MLLVIKLIWPANRPLKWVMWVQLPTWIYYETIRYHRLEITSFPGFGNEGRLETRTPLSKKLSLLWHNPHMYRLLLTTTDCLHHKYRNLEYVLTSWPARSWKEVKRWPRSYRAFYFRMTSHPWWADYAHHFMQQTRSLSAICMSTGGTSERRSEPSWQYCVCID